MKIYLGIWTKHLIGVSQPHLVTYRFLRNRKTKFIEDPKYDWMADSGAFSYVTNYCGYPFEPKEYLKSMKQQEPPIWFTMDYPCEEIVLEATGGSIEDHINWTIDNSLELCDNEGFAFVVQGRDIADYLDCLDLAKEHGLITDLIGVGTLCRRVSVQVILKILREIKRNIPTYIKIHGFGLKTTILNQLEIYKLIDSLDTRAWHYRLHGQGHIHESKEQREKDILKYRNKLNKIMNKTFDKNQVELYESVS